MNIKPIEILNAIIDRRVRGEKWYLEVGKVVDTDEANLKFTYQPNEGSAESEAFMSVFGSENYIVPAVGSIVLVGYTDKTQKYCLHVEIYEKVIFAKGDNGGLINIDALTSKLNKLVDEIQSLKTTLDTHTHIGVTVGAGVTGTPTPFVATFTDFDKTDYEDETFLH